MGPAFGRRPGRHRHPRSFPPTSGDHSNHGPQLPPSQYFQITRAGAWIRGPRSQKRKETMNNPISYLFGKRPNSSTFPHLEIALTQTKRLRSDFKRHLLHSIFTNAEKWRGPQPPRASSAAPRPPRENDPPPWRL